MKSFRRFNKSIKSRKKMELDSLSRTDAFSLYNKTYTKRKDTYTDRYSEISNYSNQITCNSKNSSSTKMLCPNCLNKEYLDYKRFQPKKPVDLGGTFGNNYLKENIIHDKIKNREILSTLAAKNVKNYENNDKEKLQNKN